MAAILFREGWVVKILPTIDRCWEVRNGVKSTKHDFSHEQNIWEHVSTVPQKTQISMKYFIVKVTYGLDSLERHIYEDGPYPY